MENSRTAMSQEFSQDFKANEFELGPQQTFDKGYSRFEAEDEQKVELSGEKRIECLKQMEIYRKLLLDQNPFIQYDHKSGTVKRHTTPSTKDIRESNIGK